MFVCLNSETVIDIDEVLLLLADHYPAYICWVPLHIIMMWNLLVRVSVNNVIDFAVLTFYSITSEIGPSLDIGNLLIFQFVWVSSAQDTSSSKICSQVLAFYPHIFFNFFRKIPTGSPLSGRAVCGLLGREETRFLTIRVLSCLPGMGHSNCPGSGPSCFSPSELFWLPCGDGKEFRVQGFARGLREQMGGRSFIWWQNSKIKHISVETEFPGSLVYSPVTLGRCTGLVPSTPVLKMDTRFPAWG